MFGDEYGLTVNTTGKLLMVLAWCVQSKDYREQVMPLLPSGEPLVDAFRQALDGDVSRFKSMIGYHGGQKMLEGITKEVVDVLEARAKRRELAYKYMMTWSPRDDAP